MRYGITLLLQYTFTIAVPNATLVIASLPGFVTVHLHIFFILLQSVLVTQNIEKTKLTVST